MTNSFELLSFLHSLHLLEDSPQWWWPNCGEFEVIVGAVLTQNTRWSNVEKSLQALYQASILLPDSNQSLENLAKISPTLLSSYIAPSGFANQKSVRLKKICENILLDFGNFENFTQEVCADWLISQKGIGFETRDSILNYACKREVMVVDKYSYKLLCLYGYDLQDYHELQEWFMQGVLEHLEAVFALYGRELPIAQIYARFHGKIVEFAKKGFKI